MAKKDTSDQPVHHTGSVAPEDKDLTLWLDRLWARNEPPSRIEVWQLCGRKSDVRGEMIHHEDFKPGEKRDIEAANRLANEIFAVAQNDCDSVPRPKPACYQIAVIDKNRTASPLTRRIGPIEPKRSRKLVRVGDAALEDEDDEDAIDAKSIALTHLRTGTDEVRRDKQRNDSVIGDVIMLLGTLIQEHRLENKELRAEMRDDRARLREAEDRRVMNELIIEEKRFKMGIMRDASRVGRNLLIGLFGDKANGGDEGGDPQPQRHLNGNSNGAAELNYGPSPERDLIDGFLNDCEEAQIDGILFGDFEEVGGKMKLKTPGIFSVKQFHILCGVRAGKLPTSELDKLVPEWGHECAVTITQVTKAMQNGLTEGIGMALMRVADLRREARAAREAAAEAAATPTNGTQQAQPTSTQQPTEATT